jgi:hypothetical protein
MKEQQRREAWDREVARKYGIDLARDRKLLDTVWKDTAGSFTDFEQFDAYVESAWSFYCLSREQPEDIEGNGGSSRSLQGGDKGLRASKVKFDDNTQAHIAAFSEYLAKIAATDRRVMRIRKRICGGLTRTISPEKARKFLEAHSIPGNEKAEGPVEWLWWPDGSSHGIRFRVLEGSVLGELQGASAYLKKRYPWTADQASYFILCGGVPQAPTIRGGYTSNSMSGVAAHKYNRTTIKLEVESWVSSELVRKAYRQLQRELHGERNNRRPSSRNVEVFRFVLDQSEIEIVNTEESLARLELPPWRKSMGSWNKQFSEGDPRCYSEVRNFHRDFDRGQQAVIGTEWGLPGVPGQPLTYQQKLAEAEASKERLTMVLKAHAENTGNAALFS